MLSERFFLGSRQIQIVDGESITDAIQVDDFLKSWEQKVVMRHQRTAENLAGVELSLEMLEETSLMIEAVVFFLDEEDQNTGEPKARNLISEPDMIIMYGTESDMAREDYSGSLKGYILETPKGNLRIESFAPDSVTDHAGWTLKQLEDIKIRSFNLVTK